MEGIGERDSLPHLAYGRARRPCRAGLLGPWKGYIAMKSNPGGAFSKKWVKNLKNGQKPSINAPKWQKWVKIPSKLAVFGDFHDCAEGLPRREAHDEMRINTPPAHMRGYSMGSPLFPQKH